MCLVPGIADGRYLLSNELLPEELAVEVDCHCGHRAARREPGISRRELVIGAGLGTAGLMAGNALSPTNATATPAGRNAESGDRVVMLGVNGGPVLSRAHSQPSLYLNVNGTGYLVDCGGDTARQLVQARLDFSSVHHVFLTHQHLDHTAGYPELALLGWVHVEQPLQSGVQLWAPPPITAMHRHLEEMFALGIELFEPIGSGAFADLVRPRQLSLPEAGIVKVTEDENVIVHATRVFHGPEVKNAYAYRFDIKATGKSVAFSGDTGPDNQQLIELAKDADLLVHEASMNSKIPEWLEHFPQSLRAAARAHFEKAHTNVVDVPKVAKAANAKRVAMCHYSLDADVKAFLREAKRSAAKHRYKGEVLAPTDLDVIAL